MNIEARAVKIALIGKLNFRSVLLLSVTVTTRIFVLLVVVVFVVVVVILDE